MDWLEILKWIGLVLAAGFIGYFGRYLAMMIINKVHKKSVSEIKETAPEVIADSETQLEEVRVKLEKKKAKAEAKKAKKAAKQ